MAAAAVHVFEDHVALQHVEDLVGGIDVEIASRVRSADDHGGELRVFPDDLVADRWLERLAMLLDPVPEAGRHQRLHRVPRRTSRASFVFTSSTPEPSAV